MLNNRFVETSFFVIEIFSKFIGKIFFFFKPLLIFKKVLSTKRPPTPLWICILPYSLFSLGISVNSLRKSLWGIFDPYFCGRIFDPCFWFFFRKLPLSHLSFWFSWIWRFWKAPFICGYAQFFLHLKLWPSELSKFWFLTVLWIFLIFLEN